MARKIDKQHVLETTVRKVFQEKDIIEIRGGFAMVNLQCLSAETHVYPFAKIGAKISHFDGLFIIEL